MRMRKDHGFPLMDSFHDVNGEQAPDTSWQYGEKFEQTHICVHFEPWNKEKPALSIPADAEDGNWLRDTLVWGRASISSHLCRHVHAV